MNSWAAFLVCVVVFVAGLFALGVVAPADRRHPAATLAGAVIVLALIVTGAAGLIIAVGGLVRFLGGL